MKFVEIVDKKTKQLKMKNHEPLKINGRLCCAVHNDTDS